MATKKPQAEYIKNPESGLNWEAGEAFLNSIADEPKPADSRGTIRAVGDTALHLGRGAVSGVRMLSDAFGADNAVSGGLRNAEEAIGNLLSAEAKGDQQRIAEIMKEAAGKGWADQVVAGVKAFGVAPGAMLAQAAGTSLPTLATAVIPGAGPAAIAARLGVAGAVGATQGAGSVKGLIYEEVKRELLATGATPEEAEARATAQQAYGGPSTGQIALGAGLGAAAGSTGAERAVAALRNGVTKAAPGLAGRVLMGGAAEAIPEMAQGGQEKYATNSALANEGFDVDPMAGVVGNATLEGLAGFGMGAAAGIPRPAVHANPNAEAADAIRAAKLPEAGPLARAANTATEARAQAVETTGQDPAQPPEPPAEPIAEPVDDPIVDRIKALPDGPKQEALRAYAVVGRSDVAKGVQQYNRKLLDRLLAENEQKAEEVAPDQAGSQAAVLPPAAVDPVSMSAGQAMPEAAAPVARAPAEPPVPLAERSDEDLSEQRRNATAPEVRNAIATELQRRRAEPRQAMAGDILNAKGSPFTIKVAAVNKAKALGAGHEAVQVKGGWVVRPKGVANGASAEVRDVPAVAAGGGGADAGAGMAPGLGHGGDAGAGMVVGDARLEPAGDAVSPVAPGPDAGHAEAVNESADVEDATPRIGTPPQAAPDQAPEAARGDEAVPAAGVPAAGAAAVESVGVAPAEQFDDSEELRQAINSAYEQHLSGKAFDGGIKKTAEALRQALLTADGAKLSEILHPRNKVSRKAFQTMTGIKLPSTVKATDEIARDVAAKISARLAQDMAAPSANQPEQANVDTSQESRTDAKSQPVRAEGGAVLQDGAAPADDRPAVSDGVAQGVPGSQEAVQADKADAGAVAKPAAKPSKPAGGKTRTADDIAREIAKSRPDDDLSELRKAAREAIVRELGQQALDDMGQGSMMTGDDLTRAIQEGQYEATREYAAKMPVPVSEDDIPLDTAVRAYAGTSHSPERRGESARRQYVRAMADAWKRAELAAGDDHAALARVTEAMGELVAGYRSRYLDALNSHSRVASTMIAGPARFPTEANRKRSEAADKKAAEASEFLKNGIARMLKAAKAPQDNSPQSELDRVRANLAERERLHELMKAANAALRKGDDQALKDLGLSDERIAQLKKPDFAGRTGFPAFSLTNNGAEIRRLRERLASAERRVSEAADGPVERTYNGVRIEENAEEDRLRLFFDDKPSDAVRDDLKSNGFRWSPKAGAWQRQLTDNARSVAEALLDRHFASEVDDGNVAMFSLSPATQSTYESRIDALFAGGKAAIGTRVLDSSDLMGLLGFPKVPLLLNESHLRDGLTSHPEMTAEAWKKVPAWIENPAMAYRSLDPKNPGRIVLVAPELLAGYPVVMAIEPNPGVVGGKPDQASTDHLLVTVFAKTTGAVPGATAARQGKLLYLAKENALAISRSGGVQFPKHDDITAGRNRILSEKHLAGYRRAQDAPAAFLGDAGSRLSRQESNERLVATQMLVDGLMTRWKRAPEVIVARNMQDPLVPQAVRDYDATLQSQGSSGEARGFIYRGKVYLLSDELQGPKQIAEVLFHEVLGHFGLRGAFGDGLNPILDQIAALRRKEVVAKAREYGLIGKVADADVAKVFAAMTQEQKRQAAEEVLAEMAQDRPELGYVKRAIAIIRSWIRRNVPGMKNMRLTDDEIIQSFIVPARGFVTSERETVEQAMVQAMRVFRQDGNEPMFSRAAPAGVAERLGDTLKAVTVTDIKKHAGYKLTDWMGLGLQALGRRQLVDLYGDMLPLDEYNRLVAQMEADKNEGGAEADKLATAWGKLKDERQLAELMHDATLAQIDPDKPLVEGDSPPQHRALQDRFNALGDGAKQVYRDAREAYRAHHEKVRQAIKDRIERSELKGERKAALLKQMDDEFFKAVKGVYFPLARFGQYVVTVKAADGKVESVGRAETKAEAEALRRNMLKAFPQDQGYQVGRVLLGKEFIADRDSVGRGFMTELYQVLDKQDMDAAQRAELEDTLGQLYLSSLPDLSWAKHGLHRKGTPGFSQDARRAFAQNMFHGARYLAKLRYSDLMQDELIAMQEHVDAWREVPDFDQNAAQRVVDEFNKRHESLMNPKSNPLSTALTSFGFIFHLGLSPASAMVNLSQTALVAYPVMGSKWGFDKAGAALLKASQQAVQGKNDIRSALNDDERAAYDEAVRRGIVDVTMAHDLAGIAQGEDAGVMWKLRPVMKWASFLFHHAERFNRQVTFVAAYRLARESGADGKAAFEQAAKATYDGHFDYGAANRPRVMQGNVAKVLLLFKQYGQNMVYTLSRQAYLAAKAGTPKERAEARKALAGLLTSHALAAGVLGLPMVTTLLAAASMLGGDDDEPWDAEVWLKNLLADTFGQKQAEVLTHGLSRLTPWDISGRVGLDKLIFPDIQEGLEGKRLAESAMASALGPVAGIGVNMLKGLQDMSEGHYARGLEAMLPSALRGPVKSIRYANEGAQDKSGITIVDEVSPAAVIGQALGFSPSEVRQATEGKSAIMAADRVLRERRSHLVSQFAMAAMAKDEEGKQEARQAIARFNEKNPDRRILPGQLIASVRSRQKRIDQAQDGVYLPKSREGAREAGRFATAE